MTSRFAAVLFSLLALAPAAASAGWGDFVKNKAEEAAKRKTGQAINEGADTAYSEGKKTASGEEKAEKPKKQGPTQEAATEDEDGSASTRDAAAAKGAAPAKDEVAAGEVYSPKFDFVPGDKVLVFDDFAETDVGEYPARWTIKDGGGNPVEVVSYKGRRWLKSIPGDEKYMRASTHWLRYDPKGDFPKKFTVELDADMGGEFSLYFTKSPNWGGDFVTFEEREIRTHNVHSTIKPFGPVVKRVSISVNGTYVKVYVGGARVLQDPDGVKRPLTRLGLQFQEVSGGTWNQSDHQMITALRVAEGGKDVTQALNSEGRIVVHGIYFDTGSDVIRPESGGALRNILQLLNDDPSLLFVIEGHTDNQGGPTVNGPLSEKRAAAVKAWLVSQGVDAKRLGTKGMGATKPIDGNETQEGRAMNRRVEFVKVSRIATAP